MSIFSMKIFDILNFLLYSKKIRGISNSVSSKIRNNKLKEIFNIYALN